MRFAIDETHDPALRSWVESANGHADFPVQNLPLGVFCPPGGAARIGVAIGDQILDLAGVSAAGLLPEAASAAARESVLNGLFGLNGEDRRALRRAISSLLSDPARQAQIAPMLHPAADCTMQLPAHIGDYTDFYAGIHHATNAGRQFRPDQPLLPNYKYVPIGYHGRASSVRVSGARLRRPVGQFRLQDAPAPAFGPCRRLDYELEMGVWMGPGNDLGEPIRIADAGSRIAGLCLLNDWSARDVQAWEYQPLGPFLAKNFLTTISPWVITAEALAPFRIAHPARPEGDPAPLPYLLDADDQAQGAFAIELSVAIQSAAMRAAGVAPAVVCQGEARHLYWTLAQLVAHHTSNGCNLSPGDLLGTGTISAPGEAGYGSLLELTLGGKRPFTLPGNEPRGFLEDGDLVVIRGVAKADGFVPIGFGACAGQVEPALAG